MMRASSYEIDVIEELRLRSWARENYVVEEQRSSQWHFVIHDEMRLKDAETQKPADNAHRSPYVPLAPVAKQIEHGTHVGQPALRRFHDSVSA